MLLKNEVEVHDHNGRFTGKFERDKGMETFYCRVIYSTHGIHTRWVLFEQTGQC